MADIAALLDLQFFQWSRPTAANPRLASAISSSATTITVTNPPLDEDGKIVAKAFLMGVKNKAGYTETIYVPANGVQGYGNTPDSTNLGTTLTGVTRGINTAGLDFTTTASLQASHEQDSPVYCNVSALHFEAIQAAQKGNIATGGENWQIGNNANNDITVYAANGDTNKPFWQYDASTNAWIYSNDGVSSTPFGTGAGVTGGDGITVTAGDIDVDTTDTVIFKNTSAGAGDAGKIPRLDSNGRLDTSITGATYTEVNQLSGTTNIAEANTFFGATDITGSEAETLTDGSDASSLHKHAIGVGLAQRVLNAGAGAVTYAHGMGKAPRMIKFTYSIDQATITNALGMTLCGHWISGVNQTIGVIPASDTLVQDVTNACISIATTTNNGATATVTAVDATNFTLTWADVGTPGASTLNILWEAYL